MGHMPATQFIRARLTLDMKRRVTAAVEHEGVSESVWLKRLIIQALLVADHGGADAASKLDAAEQRDSSCHAVCMFASVPKTCCSSKFVRRRAGCVRRPTFLS